MKKFHEMNLEEKAVWTLRFLAADCVNKAQSGHPGFPLGIADVAFVLFDDVLHFSPAAPDWPGRDRFILSAGHGSALLYSLLHLYGFLELDELKNFRQLGSRTPGHPEFRHTPGVEMTTGPLGQGFASSVGLALSSRLLSARFESQRSSDGFLPTDSRVFALVSDGDMMEGVSSEAASLAGHLRLNNLVCIYDQNGITIDGSTDLAFSEDVGARFAAYGWRVLRVDGHDRDKIRQALSEAEGETKGPTLICARTKIGFGSPLEGSNKCHGSPLGSKLNEMKESLGWPTDRDFHVSDDVREYFEVETRRRSILVADWQKQNEIWREEHEAQATLLDQYGKTGRPENYLETLIKAVGVKERATREHSEVLIQTASNILMPGVIGGSADLTGSVKTLIKDSPIIAPEQFSGSNLCYGVREGAMGAIMNGLALEGRIVPFGGTFLVFANHLIPAIRQAAMMKLRVIYLFSHDSIFVGEDGPTHQPIEQLAQLRSIPGLTVVRPADALETAVAWTIALTNTNGPTALILTRQEVPNLDRPAAFKPEDVFRGGYVMYDGNRDAPVTVIGTGSEVALALHVGQKLLYRVVSMPSVELFLAQCQKYRDRIVPPDSRVVVIEASRDAGWYRFAGRDGLVIGMNGYGASAPASVLAKHFGFNPEDVLKRVTEWI